MPNFTWLHGNADWGNTMNWSGGMLSANATARVSSGEIVRVATGGSINQLTPNNANAALAVTNSAASAAYGGTMVSAVHETRVDMALLVGGVSPSLGHTT